LDLKNVLKPYLKQQWRIPPAVDAGFVATTDAVPEVQARPRDPGQPLVCLDQTSKQSIRETCIPVPMRCGRHPNQTIALDGHY
jgi:hypothetical protein